MISLINNASTNFRGNSRIRRYQNFSAGGTNQISNIQGMSQSTQEDFVTFAERLNKTFQKETATTLEKVLAINAKAQIMAHPQCPAETRKQLKGEIENIKGEIVNNKTLVY